MQNDFARGPCLLHLFDEWIINKKIEMAAFLFVSGGDPISRKLLVWLKHAKKKAYPNLKYVGAGLRIVDVSTLACGGVTRRLSSIPALVIDGHPEPLYRPEAIRSAFLGRSHGRAALVGGQRAPTARRSGGNVGAPAAAAHNSSRAAHARVPPPPPPPPFQSTRATHRICARTRTLPVATGGRPATTSAGLREQKVEQLESDLERLIAARDRGGGRRVIRRVG